MRFPTLKDALTHSTDVQERAENFLQATSLFNVLSEFGVVEPGGSWLYKTMVDEDIDLAVTLPQSALTRELRNNCIAVLLEIRGLRKIGVSDHANFDTKKQNDSKGIWIGPQIEHDGRLWNCDIWLVDPSEPTIHMNQPIHKRMLAIKPREHDLIVQIKYFCLLSGLKQKGITSTDIYHAILEEHIQTLEEYIKSRGITDTILDQ